MLKVQRRQCKTCIYQPKHWAPEYLAFLLHEISDPRMTGHFKGFRVCHHSQNAVCAGFWARHKDDFDSGQIAQRLGLVHVVDEDKWL